MSNVHRIVLLKDVGIFKAKSQINASEKAIRFHGLVDGRDYLLRGCLTSGTASDLTESKAANK